MCRSLKHSCRSFQCLGSAVRFMYWPQFSSRLACARRRLYDGIRVLTWCGMWTEMSWHSSSTHRGYSQCTVPPSWAWAASHSSLCLKGMCGAVWCTSVNVLIQKWYPTQGISQYLTKPQAPALAQISGQPTAMNAPTAARLTSTRGLCCSVYSPRLKCHCSQCPMEAKHLSGVPSTSVSRALAGAGQLSKSSFITGCHAVSCTSWLVKAWCWLCLILHGSKG
mmetsp:Transcript_3642/g.9958  ORF Transcript_3642/g.9958 Transcript_3642/m.9958 type:complete len:222 (-) Transcript_3642:348-1013(-)